MSAKKIRLVYSGPGDVVNYDVAAETGNGRLEPGRTIDVSPELAEALQRSTSYWAAPVKAVPKKKKTAAVVKDAGVVDPDAAEGGAPKEDES